MSLLHPSVSATTTLTGVEPEDIQPNAIDVRIGRIFKHKPGQTFYLSNYERLHKETEELFPDEGGHWTLEPGTYEVLMLNTVTVGANEAGIIVPRSSLIRNGVMLNSGLYDSGYSGSMGAMLVVTAGRFIVRENSRIGQYLIFSAEMASLYNGVYGTNKPGEKKYEAAK